MVRIKYRYLLANILYPHGSKAATAPREKQNAAPSAVNLLQPTPDGLTGKLIISMIRRSVGELFGDYGVGMIANGLKVVYFSPATSTIIIRVARAQYRLVWTTLTYTTHLPPPINKPCVFRMVRVSGTIRKAEAEVIKRARAEMRRARQEAGEEAGNIDLGILGLKSNPNIRRAGEISNDDAVEEIEDDSMDEDHDDHDDSSSDG